MKREKLVTSSCLCKYGDPYPPFIPSPARKVVALLFITSESISVVGFCRWFWGCRVPAKKYVLNSRQARNAQAQFIERFLPKDNAVTDAEEQRNDERVPVRVH
jgi:hypothetical protein